MRPCWRATAIGRRIVMDIGRGVRLTVGRGSATSHGVGLHITTAAGFITATIGRGCRAAGSIETAVGGDRPSLRSTSHSATTSAGTRCRTTIAIHTRAITVTTIVDQITVAAVMEITVVAVAVVAVEAAEVAAIETTIETTTATSLGVV